MTANSWDQVNMDLAEITFRARPGSGYQAAGTGRLNFFEEAQSWRRIQD